jgi:hypothetical protein
MAYTENRMTVRRHSDVLSGDPCIALLLVSATPAGSSLLGREFRARYALA